MTKEHTHKSSSTLLGELTIGCSINTDSLSVTHLFDTDRNSLKTHRKNHQIRPNILDAYLLAGMQMVLKKDSEMRYVTPTLKLLLEFGAKWSNGMLLEGLMTPYHVICQSTGDHDELLDLIITSSRQTLINTKSLDG